jgi:hypothetical protein
VFFSFLEQVADHAIPLLLGADSGEFRMEAHARHFVRPAVIIKTVHSLINGPF